MTTSSAHGCPAAAIRLVGLGKQYANGTWGLRDVSTHLPYGRMTALIGPNGAGKSTLIHLLAHAIQPTEGAYQITDPAARIGWSSQRTTIDWYLNVIENVIVGARLAGIDRKQSRKLSQQMLELLKLGDLATNDVSMLSGGQQQRIQVARTLVADPDILLLDEPTASLDIESAESVLERIRDRARNGAAVLISSHDLGLLERFCDDVLFIYDGALIAHDPMRTFLRRFAPSDTLAFRIDGDLTPDIHERLRPFNPLVENNGMLSITLPPDISLGDVVTILEPTIRVLDITREATSLRNVYLHMTTREGGWK